MLVTPIQYLALFGLTTVLSFLLTPLLRKLAHQLDVVDRPNLSRKDQAEPVAYLGGIAVFISFSVVLLGSLWIKQFESATLNALIGMWLPALFVTGVGLVDDIRNLSAKLRLVIQTLAALVGALTLTYFGTASYLTGFIALDTFLVLIWIVTLTNSLNLMDNMDGLAAGIGGSAALIYFSIALVNGQYFVAALALALSGALLGFWYWNRSPARIYLGDAGALLIGLLLGVISIRINLVESPKLAALLIPIAVLVVPLLDTLVVVITRLQRGISPFEGGKDHLSHRLVRIGHSKTSAVRTLVMANTASGLLLIIASQLNSMISLLLVLIVLVFASYALIWFIKLPHTD